MAGVGQVRWLEAVDEVGKIGSGKENNVDAFVRTLAFTLRWEA
jgi:hypothetical protein